MAKHKRPVTNLLGLAVLGLLIEQPLHPYEMGVTLRERNKDASFKLRTGSLYDVVEALHRVDWIAAQGTVREGRRPERTVYALTELGHVEFVQWLDELVRTPVKEYPSFLAAVNYLGALGPERAVEALEERISLLDEEVRTIRATQAEALEKQVPRLFVIEADFAAEMAEAELGWCRRIVREMREGSLAWPTAGEDSSGEAMWTSTGAAS